MIAVLMTVSACVFMNQSSFGRLPRGERLEKISKSPNYRDGKFQNITPTEVMATDKSKMSSLIDFMFRKVDDLRPQNAVPALKTDLKSFRRDENVLVWLGHSTCYMQIDGVRMLIDPVLVMASPVSFINKPFEGADLYTPDDIPAIDYMIVTHDHWDHLDYKTVMALKERTGTIICGLGVGEHFEYWGFDKEKIVELDWNEQATLNKGMVIHCLPARHFSGRGLTADKTLWASFMVTSPSLNIYISGDSGYDRHFAEIGSQFSRIDFAMIENGQYNEDWKNIHLMPEDLVQAVKDLHPVSFMTVHNSKYALGKHAWYEPMENISKAAERDSLNLLTPKIGEPVYLQKKGQHYEKWWEKPE